jgi:8-oxo-dGTP pyrophosphatase MutT (NUDIX family)
MGREAQRRSRANARAWQSHGDLVWEPLGMYRADKVVAYITYENQLLVFEQPDFPEAGIQVPGGTFEAGGDAKTGVLREALEATGLVGLEVVRFLGAQEYSPEPAHVHRRNYFHLAPTAHPPATWDHLEMHPSRGERPILFRFRWVPLDAVPPLAGDRGALLAQLAAGMAQRSTASPGEHGRSDGPPKLRVRYAARVLVLDPSNRLLLLRGMAVDGTAYWLAPGGGLEPGEDYASAALREAREELGIAVELGPLVWHRRHVFETSKGTLDQTERFFVARSHTTNIAPVEPDHYVIGHRWWTLPEIQTSDEPFTPRRLGALLPAILNGDWPSVPIDVAI